MLGGAGVPLAYAGVDAARDAADNALDPEPQEAGYGYERLSPLEEALMGALSVAGGSIGALATSPEGFRGLLGNRLARASQQLIDRPMSALERRGATPERLVEMARERVVRGPSEKSGDSLSGTDQMLLKEFGAKQNVVADMLERGVSPQTVMNTVFQRRVEQGYSPERLYAIAQMSKDNDWVTGRAVEQEPVSILGRQFAAPIASHAAVAGAGALAVKGAVDVISRMMAGESVSEEEEAAAMDVVESVSGGRK